LLVFDIEIVIVVVVVDKARKVVKIVGRRPDESDCGIGRIFAIWVVGDVCWKSIALSDCRVSLSVGTGLLAKRAVSSKVLSAAKVTLEDFLERRWDVGE
jgi:hypothetical protein